MLLSLAKPIADDICPVTEPPVPPPVKNIVEFVLLQLVSSTSLKIASEVIVAPSVSPDITVPVKPTLTL